MSVGLFFLFFSDGRSLFLPCPASSLPQTDRPLIRLLNLRVAHFYLFTLVERVIAEDTEVRRFRTVDEARQDVADSGRSCDGIKVIDGSLLGVETLPCGQTDCPNCLILNQVLACAQCKAFMRRSSTACPSASCEAARAQPGDTDAGRRPRTSRAVRSLEDVQKRMKAVSS